MSVEKQTRLDSAMEVAVNTAVGFAWAVAANWIILPLVFNITVSLGENLLTAALFTIVSIVRQFAIRRAFNGRGVWQSIRDSWVGWQILNVDFWRWALQRKTQNSR